MKPKFETKKIFLKLILPLALFLLLVTPATAQYSSLQECLDQNDMDYCCTHAAEASTWSQCTQRTGLNCTSDNNCPKGWVCSNAKKCVIDSNTVPNVGGGSGGGGAIEDLSGRVSGNTASPNASGCQKSDDQCPAPNFCYINGVCVPVPKSSTGIVGASSVFELVTIVLRWLFTFAGIVATVYLIIGGYQYMTSAGNEEAAEQGRKTIVNAVIGIIAVVFAITVITIITNTLSGDNPIGYVQKETRV